MVLFVEPADYREFESALHCALEREPIRLLSYCVMPNHFHLVLWPETDEQMPLFMRRMTSIHAQRWRMARSTVGGGAVYQGRYKSVPVQVDHHLLKVCRYVERNALRAGLVDRAQDWPWSSLWARQHASSTSALAPWPIGRPENWVDLVNEPGSPEELEALRRTINRGRPIGSPSWQKEVAREFHLENTMRGRGRPKGSQLRGGSF
jgi:putative transposase